MSNEKGSTNANLHSAAKAKNDEFYTQLSDIENELYHYREHFEGKTILCNCDDPFESNFFKYFALNFEFLKLKKLIAVAYADSLIVKARTCNGHGYVAEMSFARDVNGDTAFDWTDIMEMLHNGDIKITDLQGKGDFRDKECLDLLDEVDIVVTNPPFSLFREYVSVLMEHKKKFLIIGNKNAITYKEIFPLLKNNEMWLGYCVPKDFVIPNGGLSNKLGGLTRWFTNLDISKRHENLILFKRYREDPSFYPKYDNYDAINVDKVKYIPEDYAGVVGVPITFLDNYNPAQFEVIALGNSRDNFTPNKDYLNPSKILANGTVHNGNAINCVLAINQSTKPHGIYYTADNADYLVAPYARVLIRNLHPLNNTQKGNN